MDPRNAYEESTMRVIAIAVAGWILLLAMVPGWAREGVLGFGVLYAVLVCVVDENVRAALRALVARLRSARAKRPASRRAAT